MDVTVWRTSRSTIVRELLDYSTAIFDRDGWNVAQAARIPSHLNSMSTFLTEILANHIPPEQWQPEDVVISNDPYCGGQHLPDIVAFKAVFHEGRRIGFVGTLCHHLDVGGSSPGSYGSSATEIFQEGLRIPPLKLIEAGKLVEPIRAIMLQNVRQPELLWGDIQSQIASLNIGAASIERLAAKLGEARFERALKQLLDASEAGMRAVISRIPDGTYAFEDKIDDDGITERADRHSRGGDGGRRRDDGRPDGMQPAVARPQQRHAGVDLLHRLLCPDGDGRCAGGLQCRLLPSRQGRRAAGNLRQRGLAGAGGASDRHRPPPCHRAVRRAAPGDPRPHAGRLLRRLLRRDVPDHRSASSGARCWWRSRSAAAAACLTRTAHRRIRSACTTTPTSPWR